MQNRGEKKDLNLKYIYIAELTVEVTVQWTFW
jgi:hypothetical protein